MISSRAFSLMGEQFFPTTSRSFGTFCGNENLNLIHSFKVAKPWCGNYMLRSKEIPKCGHRLSFFISYSVNGSDGRFPEFDVNGSIVNLPRGYERIHPDKKLWFLRIADGKDDCVKNGMKVKIHYIRRDSVKVEVLDSTYSKNPITMGPDKNKGLYEGIVGMRLNEIRRIVLPLSSVGTFVSLIFLWISYLIMISWVRGF